MNKNLHLDTTSRTCWRKSYQKPFLFPFERCFCSTKKGNTKKQAGVYLSSYKNTVWFSVWCVIRFFTSLKQEKVHGCLKFDHFFATTPCFHVHKGISTEALSLSQTQSQHHSPASCFACLNWYLCRNFKLHVGLANQEVW